ncbi:MAG: sugar phosphate isomerase/epimerase [Kiritimatiellae bacterium]|nr:sugar phosphate isomerase/epimerase [Kiritimatiellia bacterium]MDD5521830.1 sugar phosphate isomerase/epimerase [Kiritimatiellia bacterium]
MKNSLLISIITIFAISITGICGEQNKILVGVCGGKGNLQKAKNAGFDYIEMAASGIAKMSDADYEGLLKAVEEAKIPVRTANGFLPGDIKITGPAADPKKQDEYVRKCFSRLQKLGVKVLVFGSGGARAIPKDVSREEALKQMVDFCKRIGPMAKEHNLVVVIEPLNTKECNFINSGKEGLEIVEAVKDPNIELLVDLYHMAMENEDPAIVLKAGAHIKHCHIANPAGRVYPLSTDEYNYKPFFDNLLKIGYTGGISVEGGTKNFDADGPKAAKFLKNALQK